MQINSAGKNIIDIEIIEDGMWDSKQSLLASLCLWFLKEWWWEVISETRASCFIVVSKHLETIKALSLRPHAFICFPMFGYPNETLTLVLEIVHGWLCIVEFK